MVSIPKPNVELMRASENDFLSGLDSQPDQPKSDEDQRHCRYLQDQIVELIVDTDEYRDRGHACVMNLDVLKSRLRRLAA